jgi:hypothetical protein
LFLAVMRVFFEGKKSGFSLSRKFFASTLSQRKLR